jgi:indolepyruvate ferredoxin oxidoreductase, beta subunit
VTTATIRRDIVLAGVGGQGIVSLAALIASAGLREKFQVKQSEVHGMSQRGGAVMASLRISNGRIHSDLIPAGTADLILAMEPLESLRYLAWLKPGGSLITSCDPVLNIPDYPDLEELLAGIAAMPNAVLVKAARLAKQAGAPKSINVVMAGAAAHLLPFAPESLEAQIRTLFARKGDAVVQANLRALEAGRGAIVRPAA